MLERGEMVSRQSIPAGVTVRFVSISSRRRRFRSLFELLAQVSAALLVAPALSAQGSLTTGDGLRLGLGANGAVTSLQVNGTEYAAAGMPSGLAYRELPPTAPNIAPNGSFESGASTPTSWSWTNNSAGTWSVDTTTVAAGSRSLKLSVPGTIDKRSPQLKSTTFAVLPNTPYTLTAQMKTIGIDGVMTLFFVEQRSDGTSVQPHFSCALGTTPWTTSTLRFTTGANAVSAYFKAEIYSGHGTVWLDDIQLSDVFGGRVPIPFGGTVTGSGGVLTQTASGSGLDLTATYSSVGSAIRVDATLTDTTGQDRPIEMSYRLPVDAAGWKWGNHIYSSTVIQDGVRYENVDTSVGKQGRSMYPFATVSGPSTSFSLAVPMGPQMQRFGYATSNGLRSTWALGLSAAATKTKSKASWTFWIYASSGPWGLRAGAEKYYSLTPASFTTSVKLQGAWALPSGGSDLEGIPNFQDFGWGVQEGTADVAFNNQHGILSYTYLFPNGWFHDFPDGPQPSYNTLISALNNDAANGTGTTVNSTPVKEMAQAIINSSPYNANQQYTVMDNYYFWYKNYIQIFPAFADPDIPAPSMYSVLKKYGVDNRIDMFANAGGLDGVFLDNVSYIFMGIENHRRSLWAYSDFPLSFSYASRKVVQFGGAPIAEFCQTLRTYLAGKNMGVMGSNTSVDLVWVAPWVDIVGGEVNANNDPTNVYLKRVLAYGKNWTNLFVPPQGTGAPTATEVLTYFRNALLLGYYPGFNGAYWSVPSAYERDRSLFKQYMPLIKKIIQAGWRPVSYATPSDAAIFVERFDSEQGGAFYLTAQNSGTATKSFQLSLDGTALGAGSGAVTVKELVGNTTISASRSGSTILFSDSLAAGETALYEVTVSSACDATYGDLNQDGRADATDLVILSHYLVGNMTPGSAPFTAPLSKADLDRSGTVDAVDLVVLQNYLVGNVACLPK